MFMFELLLISPLRQSNAKWIDGFLASNSNMAQFSNEKGILCRNVTNEESFEYIEFEYIMILVCFPVICISGLLLNLSYLFVLYRVRDMRTTTNVYLGNLAVADSFLLLIRLARYVGTYFYSPVDIINITPFNNSVTCGFPILLRQFFNHVSMFFISLVAFERYNSICRPFTHRRTSSKQRTMRQTLFAWILPFIFISCHTGSFDFKDNCLTLPSLSSSMVFKVCPWKRWASISIKLFYQCHFWTALIGNCTMYIAIVRKLSRDTDSNKSARERNHVAKMLIINAGIFFICLLPMQILTLCTLVHIFNNFDYYQLIRTPNLFLWIAILTSLMNSAVNPLIYGATNPNYRKAFRKAFFSSCLPDRADAPGFDMTRKDIET